MEAKIGVSTLEGFLRSFLHKSIFCVELTSNKRRFLKDVHKVVAGCCFSLLAFAVNVELVDN